MAYLKFWLARLSSMGDVICSLPAAVALRRTFPDAEIHWAVAPAFTDLVRDCRAVNRVFPVQPGFDPRTWPTGEGEYDAAFDLQGLFKSASSIARIRASIKLGYHWQREGANFFSAAVRPDATSVHIVDQYVDVVRAFSVPDPEAPVPDRKPFQTAPAAPRLYPVSPIARAEFDLVPSDEATQSIQAKLRALEVTRFVAINPGAGWISKRWPPAAFAELMDRMRDSDRQFVLIGGRSNDERAIAREISGGRPAVKVMTGETSLAELVALLNLADAHLGGDTGSTHLAAALGIPAVGLYSLTHPDRSCPYGQRERCLHAPEGLASIPVDAVEAQIRRALSER